ncbi:MAG TPA: Gfo/Idh/MocA family oxidoreductase [Anaerolineae bacterium]|nr:Gfo/Idh/MocA family oxidoreductase [Anaerolineae bacterium]
MTKKIRTVHIGLGHMGSEIARLVQRRDDMEIVGAVDPAPDKAGADLGEVIGLERLDIPVAESIADLLAGTEADVAVQATGSYLPQVESQLRELLSAGLSIVSTCEELAYPSLQHPQLAQELDELARKHGVALLGTGVNPGFVMDKLPIVLTGACQEVRSLRVTRVVDASRRRLPLQQKTGAGLTVAEFEARARAKAIQHVGLPESLALIATALGWSLDEVEDTIEPVVAREAVASEHIRVEAGQVAGLHQVAIGRAGGRDVLTLDLWMILQAENPRDEVLIDGIPPLHMVIPGGTHGDRATVAVIVNAIPQVAAASPGLKTILDLPPSPGRGV